jgi:hypothetical protein
MECNGAMSEIFCHQFSQFLHGCGDLDARGKWWADETRIYGKPLQRPRCCRLGAQNVSQGHAYNMSSELMSSLGTFGVEDGRVNLGVAGEPLTLSANSTLRLHVQHQWFLHLESGAKLAEGRLADPELRSFLLGATWATGPNLVSGELHSCSITLEMWTTNKVDGMERELTCTLPVSSWSWVG